MDNEKRGCGVDNRKEGVACIMEKILWCGYLKKLYMDNGNEGGHGYCIRWSG